MARNQVQPTGKQAGQLAWQRSFRGFFFWFASLLLTGLAWLGLRPLFTGGPSSIMSAASIVYLGGIQTFLALGIERSLVYTSLPRNWQYRLSFLASAGIFFVLWGVYRFAGQDPLTFASTSQQEISTSLLIIIPILFASFSGALLATTMDEGLWEDNSPPAERLQAEVYRQHLEATGATQAGARDKQIFDRSLALIGLILSAPVWILSAILIWLEDPGPVLFVKNSVGKGGINFRQYKFRTMVSGAENETGPVWSQEGDGRVLLFGRLLRKTALDELPQLINILRGEMSFVGPRPQRTVLVREYLVKLPAYAERHMVLPGLSGLAQVAGDYYLTPHQKLRFDRLYIQHASLGFDLKLLLLAFLITFWFRWQRNWDGRLPRRLLHKR